VIGVQVIADADDGAKERSGLFVGFVTATL
jgi:hypothetical protein